MAPASTRLWTADRDAQLCRLVSEKRTTDQIAAHMSISRNTVTGRVKRLRDAGDPRLPAAGRSAVLPRRPKRSPDAAWKERLAILMERGCPTLKAAAYQLMISIERVEGLWSSICRDLGPQAV